MLTRNKLLDRRQLLYLAVFAAAIFLLLPRIVGADHVISLLQAAKPTYLVLALAAETTRYLVSAGSTVVLARLFGRVIPFLPTVQAFFVGAAANRTFSVSGAPGVLVRLIFLTRQGVTAGSVGVIYFIEDVAGLVIGSLIFVVGIATLTNRHPSAFFTRAAITFSIGAALFVLGSFYLLRNRAGAERMVHWLARGFNALVERLLHRPLYTSDRVQHVLDDFYTGLDAARRAPAFVVAVFAFNLIRHGAGIAALYFTFLALNHPIAPGIMLLIYTSANVLSAASAVPGEIAIMGSGFAILFLTLGVAPDLAMLALLLSRAVSFWLPLPVGYLAFWNLRQRNYL